MVLSTIVQKIIQSIFLYLLFPDELINIRILTKQFSQIIVTTHLEPVLSDLFRGLKSLHLCDLVPSNQHNLSFYLLVSEIPLSVLLFFPLFYQLLFTIILLRHKTLIRIYNSISITVLMEKQRNQPL